MKFALLSPFFLLSFASVSQAATCKDLKTCTAVMHELTGQRYLWEAKDESPIAASPDLELTKETAEIVFTAMLDQVGLARAPVGDGKTYRIVRSAYRKEMELPMVEANADTKPKFPDTWDWMAMRYKTKSRELTDNIEMTYRLHLPREARMQSDSNAGYLIVEGPAPLVRHMYEVIKGADVPITAAIRENMKEQHLRMQAIQAQMQQGSSKK